MVGNAFHFRARSIGAKCRSSKYRMCRARIGYCPSGSTSSSSSGYRSTSFAEIKGRSSDRLLTLALSSSARTRD